MKTKNEVIEFIRSESENGNAIVYATIGQGGAGLTISSYDFTYDLYDMDFDGKVRPDKVCDDILSWREFDAQHFSVYQFSDDNGLKYQVVTF